MHLTKDIMLKTASFILFLGLLWVGVELAKHKPLWGDEVYSQHGVQELSYGKILLGRINEGNNSPLFYLIQKGITDLTGYRLPPQGSWDQKLRVLLRLAPNAVMSLALVLTFYFFARNYALWAGAYGFLTALFSFNVWLYWGEARPYALWFFLTIAQSLLFLYIIKRPEGYLKSWRWLTAVHLLLASTVIFSFLQIAVVSVLLWLLKEKNWKKYVGLFIIPCIMIVYYYFLAPKYKFFFPRTALQLIYPGFPKEWMLFLGLYMIALISSLRKKPRPFEIRKDPNIAVISYMMLTSLILLGAAVVLACFKAGSVLPGQGFEISHRYFIYLTPIGAVAVTLAAIELMKVCQHHRWLKINVIMGLWAFLVISLLRNSLWAMWFF